tara:strand:- start:606 stop:815 length:210 start_codon:yes stop_codon:yes gene_type:complete
MLAAKCFGCSSETFVADELENIRQLNLPICYLLALTLDLRREVPHELPREFSQARDRQLFTELMVSFVE